MQTVKEQLVEGLEAVLTGFIALGKAVEEKYGPPPSDFRQRVEAAQTALDRARAEPESDIHTIPCEKCRGTGALHVAGEPTQEPCGECSGEGVVCKPEEADFAPCKCDGPECPGYQEGLEAQRERVG